jgi:hypothetical protein
VAVQLAQIVGGTGEQPFAFARGQAAPGHHGEFLAGLELPEHRFHGALDEAWLAFEKMLTYANHLGLYAE